ncbi:MAG: MFS transporter [Gemmatimonadota bacterium]
MNRSPWRSLALLAIAEFLGMSLWFAPNAVAAELQLRWGLTSSELGWLTAAVQVGFVAGTAASAVLNLADLLPSRVYFATCSLCAALVNATLLLIPGYPLALVARFGTGFFLAGVYPPAMKMVATWFRERRGLAIGVLIASLTVGKALPYLVRAFDASFAQVLIATSIGALTAAVLVLFFYSDGPWPFPRLPFSWSLALTVLRHRPTRLATGGYLGHMWELYAMWTWIPVFLAASVTASGGHESSMALNLAAFLAIAAGGAGCIWGGWVAGRWGYGRTVTVAMALSGATALGIGLVFGMSFWIVVLIVTFWGFFIVADSAQFSAMITEVTPPHAVGTALTLQTSLGFLLTMVTIQLVPAFAEHHGWRWAFAMLALGPVLGIAAIRQLKATVPGSGAPRPS